MIPPPPWGVIIVGLLAIMALCVAPIVAVVM